MSGLRVEKLTKSYDKRRVVDELSFELNGGEIVSLLGPNGAGKTTTFYMTLGLIPADSGQVFLNDVEITNLPMHSRARLGIAYLPQEASIFRKLTVAQNIEAILEMHCETKGEIKKKLNRLLADLYLDKVRNQKGFTLSGGERRRCEIARALAIKPRYILLDEPFAGVDPIAVIDIQKLIHWLCKQGIGILITDHNVRETLKVSHRSYIVYAGKILESGNAKKLVANPQVRKKYLGSDFRL